MSSLLSQILALAILVSLSLYLVLGGADFGGGIWDLLAVGPRAKKQRALIDSAIAPVWEANHVWLILALVLMFSAFPPAFHKIVTDLYVPLSILLIGIVLRGAAFIFRHYGPGHSDVWGRLFAATSLLAPFCLGWCWGVVRAGQPWATAIATTFACAYLAAVFLTQESGDAGLRQDFKLRALLLGNPIALVWILIGPAEISQFARLFIFILGFCAFRALQKDRFQIARYLAAACVFGLGIAWGTGQYPFLVYPDFTIANSAAPPETLKYLVIALTGGGLLLFPSLFWLFRIFKK